MFLDPTLPKTIIYNYYLNLEDADVATLRSLNCAWRGIIDQVTQLWMNAVFAPLENWYPYQSETLEGSKNGYLRFRAFRCFLQERLNEYTYGKYQDEANQWNVKYGNTKNIVIVQDLFVWLKNHLLIDFYANIQDLPPISGKTVDEASTVAWKVLRQKSNLECRDTGEMAAIPLLPIDITRLKVQTLNLRTFQLEILPPRLGKMRSLKELKLDNNFLSSLPENLSALTQLQLVSLSCNKLKEIPSFLYSLPSLTKLDLSANWICEIPEKINQMRALVEFDLSGNDFTTLPGTIAHLPFLKKLDCTRVPLNLVSQEFYEKLKTRIERVVSHSPPQSPGRYEPSLTLEKDV